MLVVITNRKAHSVDFLFVTVTLNDLERPPTRAISAIAGFLLMHVRSYRLMIRARNVQIDGIAVNGL